MTSLQSRCNDFHPRSTCMTCRRQIRPTLFPRLGQNQEHIITLLEALPAVSEKELEKLGHTGTLRKSVESIALISPSDSACSICMQPLLAILAEEETASAMESPAFYSGELGVTRLSQPWQCGHIFCRRELRVLSSLNCDSPIFRNFA